MLQRRFKYVILISIDFVLTQVNCDSKGSMLWELTVRFLQAMKYIDQAPDYDKKMELINVSATSFAVSTLLSSRNTLCFSISKGSMLWHVYHVFYFLCIFCIVADTEGGYRWEDSCGA